MVQAPSCVEVHRPPHEEQFTPTVVIPTTTKPVQCNLSEMPGPNKVHLVQGSIVFKINSLGNPSIETLARTSALLLTKDLTGEKLDWQSLDVNTLFQNAA